MATSDELYFSVDIESDGPIPSDHSMLSLGAAAFLTDGTVVGTFYVNLKPLPEATQHPDTMAFWAKNPDAWLACTKDPCDPKEAMADFALWVAELCNPREVNPVLVAYPAGFDHMFIHWYLMHFVGESPFSFSALDMKSYAMAKLGTPFRKTTKKHMPKRWFSNAPHTHVALDDAIEQGHLFISMLNERAPKSSDPGPQPEVDAWYALPDEEKEKVLFLLAEQIHTLPPDTSLAHQKALSVLHAISHR